MMLDGSLVSKVFLILCLRFRFQGEGTFLVLPGPPSLAVPDFIHWDSVGLVTQSATRVLLPLTGERVPGRQSQQMST